MANTLSLPDLGAALAGLSALSTAAFGLLDATKAFEGGVSNIGFGPIETALDKYKAPLASAIGPDWKQIVRSHWVSGTPKAEQKAKAQAMIKLGLSAANAGPIAAAALVDEKALTAAAAKLDKGQKLDDRDLNVLGRLNAAIDIQLDAAFDRADQRYRNVMRLLAGLVAIGLSITAWALWQPEFGKPPTLLMAVVVGLLAVPLAPVAKDLTSALSAAMNALKAARKV
jgi:hypothetical protein